MRSATIYNSFYKEIDFTRPLANLKMLLKGLVGFWQRFNIKTRVEKMLSGVMWYLFTRGARKGNNE